MLPNSILKSIMWGIDKQIEMVEQNIDYLSNPDLPKSLRPLPSEIAYQLIDIEKSLSYVEDQLQFKVDSLRKKFEEIKKTSPGRLISVLA